MAEEDFSFTSDSSDSECDEAPVPTNSSSRCGFLTLKTGKQEKAQEPPSKRNDPIKSIKLSSSIQAPLEYKSYLCIRPERNLPELDEKMKQLAFGLPGSETVAPRPQFQKNSVSTVRSYWESRNKRRREGLKERDKTKGAAWYNMPATEVTEEIKNDLTILQMRNSLDPKHFYKRGSENIFPKYFSVGTVVESPLDFYHSRIPKKQRKRTLVEEHLADFEFLKYQKKKYDEAMKCHYMQNFHASQKEKKKIKQKLRDNSEETQKKQKLMNNSERAQNKLKGNNNEKKNRSLSRAALKKQKLHSRNNNTYKKKQKRRPERKR